MRAARRTLGSALHVSLDETSGCATSRCKRRAPHDDSRLMQAAAWSDKFSDEPSPRTNAKTRPEAEVDSASSSRSVARNLRRTGGTRSDLCGRRGVGWGGEGGWGERNSRVQDGSGERSRSRRRRGRNGARPAIFAGVVGTMPDRSEEDGAGALRISEAIAGSRDSSRKCRAPAQDRRRTGPEGTSSRG